MNEHVLDIRPRYSECDPMGVVHHTVYPIWFEMGRTELLRATGTSYRDLEEQGILIVVVRLDVRYKQAAQYDEVLCLHTRLESIGRVKIEHSYELMRGHDLLVTGKTTLACLDRSGQPTQVPDSLVDSYGVSG